MKSAEQLKQNTKVNPIAPRSAGEWFLNSGIQESTGGVARYYFSDRKRNAPLSTEITGYAVSALVNLYKQTSDVTYLDAAIKAGCYLVRAWNEECSAMPFETEGEGSKYLLLRQWHHRPRTAIGVAGIQERRISRYCRKSRRLHGAGFATAPISLQSSNSPPKPRFAIRHVGRAVPRAISSKPHSAGSNFGRPPASSAISIAIVECLSHL